MLLKTALLPTALMWGVFKATRFQLNYLLHFLLNRIKSHELLFPSNLLHSRLIDPLVLVPEESRLHLLAFDVKDSGWLYGKLRSALNHVTAAQCCGVVQVWLKPRKSATHTFNEIITNEQIYHNRNMKKHVSVWIKTTIYPAIVLHKLYAKLINKERMNDSLVYCTGKPLDSFFKGDLLSSFYIFLFWDFDVA